MANRGRPATGRVRRSHISVWVLPAVAELLRRYCEETKRPQVEVIEGAIKKGCTCTQQ